VIAPGRWLRRLARRSLDAFDRALHPVRRRSVLRSLSHQGVPRSVLFVCYGNICRSPYAAVAFQHRLPPALRDGVEVRSAGFIGPGRPSPTEAVKVAAARGLDLTAHRSALLTPEGVAGAGLVVVMDRAQQRTVCAHYGKRLGEVVILGDLDPHAIETRHVIDPWNQPESVFEACYTRIDRCLQALITVASAAEPNGLRN
jgi:protein-tyrosine phosphatase